MNRLEFEIVPNLSEGRDVAVIEACAAAMSAAGARVVHRTSDPVHHRSVITAVGSGAQVVAAAVALARVAHERIDLRRHRGAHPRIGALDVLPFVPLGAATLEDAVVLAHRAAGRIWRELGIPAYLYGAAASAPHRAHLADVRRGEFEGLAARHAADPGWRFDYGDAPHASAGAVAVGARPFLIAYNVELASGDLELAKRIARTLRGSSGGLRHAQVPGPAAGRRPGAGLVQPDRRRRGAALPGDRAGAPGRRPGGCRAAAQRADRPGPGTGGRAHGARVCGGARRPAGPGGPCRPSVASGDGARRFRR